jgi:SnoaL-like domain
MNRRRMLAVSAAVLSSAGSISAVGVVAGTQQPSEIDKVREASTALYASLSSLDVRPMERFWAHESYVRYIGPTSKAVAVGWDEIKKAIEAGNAALSARRVVLTQAHIQINGQLAWEVGIEMTPATWPRWINLDRWETPQVRALPPLPKTGRRFKDLDSDPVRHDLRQGHVVKLSNAFDDKNATIEDGGGRQGFSMVSHSQALSVHLPR